MVTKDHKSLNKPAGLFKYVWSFVPPGAKGLKELNICQTKNYKKLSLWAGQLLIYLCASFYFGIKSHKIEHTIKLHD